MAREELPDCGNCGHRIITFHMLYDKPDWPRGEWVYWCKNCGKLKGMDVLRWLEASP